MFWVDLIEISLRSLFVTLAATLIAAVIAMPFGAWMALTPFRGRAPTVAIMNALMGMPPVVVGLVVYLLFSRSGPFGVLGLLFTPTAMIIAQIIIIVPLIASLTHQACRDLWSDYRDLLTSIQASKAQSLRLILRDGRFALLTAGLAGFGRAIGEVGAIMIVGGNIDHATRVLTTAITLETSKGNLEFAVALGAVLISLSLLVSVALHILARRQDVTP